MHGSASFHGAKAIKNFPHENKVPTLKWQGNSPDLNLKECVGHKEQMATIPTPSIPRLQEATTRVWRDLDQDYFENLTTSMP